MNLGYRSLFAGLASVLLLAAVLYWAGFFGDRITREEERLPEDHVTVYFLDQDKYVLKPVKRSVPEAPDQSTRIKQIITQLTKDPEDPALVRLAPSNLQLRSSYLDGQIVYLDFNDKLVGAAQGSSGEMMLLYSIVNSVLKNMPSEYKLVQFLVQGEVRKTIGPYGEESGHIAIQYPLGPRWNLADTST